MNTDRKILHALGPGVLLVTLAACAGDDSTTKPMNNTSGTTGTSGTTATSGTGATTSSTSGTTSSGATSGTTGTTAGSTSTSGGTGGSGSTSTTSGSAGSSTVATTSTGAGGSTGSGGTGVGTGGSGSGACTVAAGTNAVISNFDDMRPLVLMNDGRQGTWVTTPSGMTTVESGVLHAVTTAGSWASTGAVIANTQCYDASRYMGISFKVKSATNTSLLFVVQTPDTAADSSHMRAPVTISPTMTTVQVPFSSLMKATFGAGANLPAGYMAQSKMTGIAFGVGTEMERLDLFIDDVTFY